MKYDDSIRRYERKRVQIVLKNGYKYTCVVQEANENFIDIIDKFGNKVLLDYEDIILISGVQV